MKKYLVLIAILLTMVACSEDDSNPVVNNPDGLDLSQEARNGYEYLNSVRLNPSAYSNEIGTDLSYVKSRHKLVWNSNLQKAAEIKARDMANRNYFEHVDPEGYGMNYHINKNGYTLIPDFLKNKSDNFFESIAAGVGKGKDFIKMLILDKGFEQNPGHRKHLLGIDDFWANCYDIGIGIAYNPNSQYRYYACVLVAKHDF